jgi:hypothetical protein
LKPLFAGVLFVLVAVGCDNPYCDSACEAIVGCGAEAAYPKFECHARFPTCADEPASNTDCLDCLANHKDKCDTLRDGSACLSPCWKYRSN